VCFTKGDETRQADIVAYDRPAEDANAKPFLVIEYVDQEDRDTVGRRWLALTRAPVVAVLSDKELRLYSQKDSWDSRAHAFEAMSAKQAPACRAWRRLQGLHLEEVRSWFMSIRRGTGLAAPLSQRLFEAMRDEG
jgi:hypothetical protein